MGERAVGRLIERNEYLIHETHGELMIRTTFGCVEGTVLFDLEDFKTLYNVSWRLTEKGYARRNGSPSRRMHRLLMDAPADLQVDHINGNRLDNRKSNLRLVTHLENCQNRTQTSSSKESGLPLGVHLDKRDGRFIGEIVVFGKRKRKRFKTVDGASSWYQNEKQKALRRGEG